MKPIVLVVEDCTPVARVIAAHLESAGYRAIVAESALEAQRALHATTPDCIVLDLLMPGMSGSELLHQLRREPATQAIPVVLASARVGHHGTHFRSQLDADYSVGKPFTKQQLLQAVRTVLSRAARSTPPAPAPSRDVDDLRV
jgi:twitching motility two-component system response regulator PilH